MMHEALTEAARRLSAVSDTPRLDAEILFAHALGITREAVILNPPARVPVGFDALIARRLAHEPIAYITGTRDFWTISLNVSPGVLIPRPDSETLIEAAIGHFGRRAPIRVLDLGTGSGALLLAALDHWPDAVGLGVDASPVALEIAKANAVKLGLAARASFGSGNWAEGLEGPFDLILCNPPYVEEDAPLSPEVRDHEPASALFAGPEGLDDYHRIAPQLPPLLAADGCAILEIGASQAKRVGAILAAAGLKTVVRQDLGQRDRALIATK